MKVPLLLGLLAPGRRARGRGAPPSPFSPSPRSFLRARNPHFQKRLTLKVRVPSPGKARGRDGKARSPGWKSPGEGENREHLGGALLELSWSHHGPLQDGPGGPSGASRKPQEGSQEGHKTAQEGSRRAPVMYIIRGFGYIDPPGSLGALLRPPRGTGRAPSGVQEGPSGAYNSRPWLCSPLGPPWAPLGTLSGPLQDGLGAPQKGAPRRLQEGPKGDPNDAATAVAHFWSALRTLLGLSWIPLPPVPNGLGVSKGAPR